MLRVPLCESVCVVDEGYQRVCERVAREVMLRLFFYPDGGFARALDMTLMSSQLVYKIDGW